MLNKLLGYRHGYTEPGIETQLKIVIHRNINFENIDFIAQKIFGNQFDYLNEVNQEYLSFEEKYLCRLLIILSYLQRLSGIPTFKIGKILCFTFNKSNNELSANIFTPFLDFIPFRHLKNLIIHSRDMISNMSQVPNKNQINLHDFWENINKVIKPIRKFTQSGISTMPLLNIVSEKNIPLRHLGDGIYMIGVGKELRMICKSSIDLDSSIGALISCKKDLTARVLKLAGLPTPLHYSIANIEEANQAAKKIGFPLVIKPSDCERSEGVTINIRSFEKIRDAFNNAKKISNNILIEKQVNGTCYRLMIANKKFLYAVKRLPRLLIGDGVLSIRELITIDNNNNTLQPPWLQKNKILIDDDLIMLIERQGFHMDAILPPEKNIYIKEIESTEWGETTFDVTDTVSSENIEIAEKAAHILNLQNAGVDMITLDITKPYYEVGGVINEVNFRPHFGGTTAAKLRIPQYIDSLISNNGLIPIEVYIGDNQAQIQAERRQKQLAKNKINAFVVNHLTIVSQHRKKDYPNKGLFKLTQQLLMDNTAEAIIMVVSTDELIHKGLPVNFIHQLKLVNKKILSTKWSAIDYDSSIAAKNLELLFKKYIVK